MPVSNHNPTTDPGFTLIELLAVMIIIGVLAGIAIPTFLGRRGQAFDTSTKSDAGKVAQEIGGYWIDGTSGLTTQYTAPAGGNRATLELVDGAGVSVSVIELSEGTERPAANFEAGLGSATAWCVALTNPDGVKKGFRYSGAKGLEEGDCTGF